MPPRGANQGFSITPIITHHLFLFTTFLAIAGWFTAFVSQCFLTSDLRKAAGPAIGSLWFAIFLELFFILGVLYTIATDSIAMHRLQISVFGAVAIVFSVEGTTTGIYAANGAANAMGAGYLILSIVNILWVGYFTSEDDSLALHIFNMLGTGGLTPPSRRRRTRQSSILHGGMQSGNGYPANYGSGGGIGSADGYDAKLGSGAYGSPNPAGLRNQNSFGGSLNDNTRSIGGAGGPASIHNQTSIGGQGSIAGADNGPSSPLMVGIGSGNSGTNLDQASPPTEQYLYKAKALYAYTANPDDPNEISFAKGEILDIVDKQGKWWQAKKADGTSGIAPSNYLHVI